MSPFLAGFTWLLLFQCAGEALVRLADLPIPGPVLGMALLLVALLGKGRATESMTVAADGLAVTAVTFQWLVRRQERAGEGSPQ